MFQFQLVYYEYELRYIKKWSKERNKGIFHAFVSPLVLWNTCLLFLVVTATAITKQHMMIHFYLSNQIQGPCSSYGQTDQWGEVPPHRGVHAVCGGVVSATAETRNERHTETCLSGHRRPHCAGGGYHKVCALNITLPNHNLTTVFLALLCSFQSHGRAHLSRT